MYKRRTIEPRKFEPAPTDTYDSTSKFHSFGYYVLGGMDVTGEHLETNASVGYDEEKDIESGCGVDSFCDPNIGFFEVAEEMGADVAMQVEQAKADNQ